MTLRVREIKSLGDLKATHTLRANIEAADPADTTLLIFRTAGVIHLDEDLVIDGKANIIVAGETAPWPGIFVTGHSIVGRDCSNVQLRHLNAWPCQHGAKMTTINGKLVAVVDRTGKELQNLDCIRFESTTSDAGMIGNLVYRSNLMFGTDELASAWPYGAAGAGGMLDMAWKDNIFAYALRNAGHEEGEHDKGLLLGHDCGKNLVTGNLFAFTHERNPVLGENAPAGIYNNVLYGVRKFACHVSDPGPIRVSYQNNVDLIGPERKFQGSYTKKAIFTVEQAGPGSEIHVAGNQGWFGTDDDRDLSFWSNYDQYRVPNAPADVPTATILPTTEVLDYVLANAGPKYRHPVVERLIAEIERKRQSGIGQGKIINDQLEVGIDLNDIPKIKVETTKFDTSGLNESNYEAWLAEFEAGKDPAQTPV